MTTYPSTVRTQRALDRLEALKRRCKLGFVHIDDAEEELTSADISDAELAEVLSGTLLTGFGRDALFALLGSREVEGR